jgi:DNA-binding SARP family transcriptional activator
MGSPEQRSSLRVALLGSLEVYVGQALVELPDRAEQLRMLLAALALRAGTVVAAETLAEVVGGEKGCEASTLRSHVSRLRAALGAPGPELVVHRAPGYLLQAGDDEVDVRLFRRLCRDGRTALHQGSWARADQLFGEALALWRGEPLADIPSEQLRRDEVPVLQELRLQAEEGRADAALHLGRHAELVPALIELAADHPHRERFSAQLMLALYWCGRQAEALEVYRDVRGVLVDELGIEPGPELQQLQQRILSGDPSLALPAPAQPENAAHGPFMPRGLPPAVRRFIGRDAELEALNTILDQEADGEPGTVVALVISGEGGVGKTALALNFAHRVAGQFGDGHLYVNLRGFDPSGTPVTAAEAIRGCLDALGVHADGIPPEPDAQERQYRRLTADKKMLLVLDNARDAEQVRPLLPASPHSLVIVTSRFKLAALAATHGARLLPLGLLSHEEAVRLLTARIGRRRAAAEPGAISRIADLCACLPLALAVAAARAQERPRLELADLADELKDATGGRLDALDAGGDQAASVRAVLSWSYRQLSGPAARLFRLLGVHPGPDISMPAAASLAGAGHDQVRRLLRELVDAHLIVEHHGRFTFHDLLRAYAAEKARQCDSDQDRAGATMRVLDHYLHTAGAGYRLIRPAFEPLALPAQLSRGTSPEQPADHRQALAWMSAEHHVLIAVIALAAKTKEAGRHAWQLAVAVTEHLHRGGYYQEEVAVATAAVKAANRLGDPRAQAMTLRALGSCNLDTGDHDQARDHLGRSLRLFRELADQHGEAITRQYLSMLEERQGDYAATLSHNQKALDLCRAIGNQLGEAISLNNVGWSQALLGKFTLARESCRQALDLIAGFDESCDWEWAAWDSAAYIEDHAGDYAAAVAHYKHAVRAAGDHGDRPAQAASLDHLGDVYQAAGERKQAEGAWDQALDLYVKMHHPAADDVSAKLSKARATGENDRASPLR